MTAPQAAPPVTRTEAVRRAREIAPAIAARAALAARERRVPEASIAEYRAAGLDRLFVPRRFGGWELELVANYDVTREIGKACGSTAWCTGLVNVHAWMLGQASERAQADVWGERPDVHVCGSFMPAADVRRVEGGYRIGGTWSSVSGVDHSAWAWLGGHVPDAQDPGRTDHSLFLVPADAYTVRDTWHAGGLRGTGSNTVRAEDVFVPEHRRVSLADLYAGRGPGAAAQESDLYRLSFSEAYQHAFLAPIVGVAVGAVEEWEAQLARRSADARVAARRASPRVQLAGARGRADIRLADTALRDLFARVAPPPSEPDLVARAEIQLLCARAARLLQSGVGQLLEASGSRLVLDDNPLQRAWQDVRVGTLHTVLDLDAAAEGYAARRFAEAAA